jgi:peptide chain release factor 2
MKNQLKDFEVVTFRRSRGNGGQHSNKTETAIRITHVPTGIRVEACSERSRSANLEAAWAIMHARLEARAKCAADDRRKAAWGAMPDAARGQWDRSYVLCGSRRRVVDRRTGAESDNPLEVLAGRIDSFLSAHRRSRGHQENG